MTECKRFVKLRLKATIPMWGMGQKEHKVVKKHQKDSTRDFFFLIWVF